MAGGFIEEEAATSRRQSNAKGFHVFFLDFVEKIKNISENLFVVSLNKLAHLHSITYVNDFYI